MPPIMGVMASSLAVCLERLDFLTADELRGFLAQLRWLRPAEHDAAHSIQQGSYQ